MPTATYQSTSQTVVDTELKTVGGSASYVGDTLTTIVVQSASVMGSVTVSRGIFDFDTSNLPADTVVTSATLDLYITAYGGGGAGFYAVGSNEIFNTTGSFPTWTQRALGIGWGTDGGSAVGPQSPTTLSPSGAGAVQYDVTKIVEWCRDNNASDRHVVIVVKHQNETDTADSATFASSNHGTSNYRPKLTINYQRGKGAMGQAVFYGGRLRRLRRRAGKK